VTPSRGTSQIAELVARRARFRSPHLRATMAKIFADGVIESHTAALLAPYLDTPGNAGPMNVRPGLLDTLVTSLDSAGFQIHVHAIGDRAIRSTLDALELARQKNGVRDTRPTIAHLELIDPADVPRFRELGVAPNFQSLWAFEDSYIRDLTVPQLGPERSRWLYPINSVLKTGAVVVGGSDWPVSSMNPLEAIQVGVTRRDPGAPPGPAWIPEETASLADLLAMYTINGAWLAHAEHETGSIEAGKSADLIVLDKNLFAIPASEIHAAHVLLTMLQGKVVWRDPSFAAVDAGVRHLP
jgi:predicted amidohydrolase YtcJ